MLNKSEEVKEELKVYIHIKETLKSGIPDIKKQI